MEVFEIEVKRHRPNPHEGNDTIGIKVRVNDGEDALAAIDHADYLIGQRLTNPQPKQFVKVAESNVTSLDEEKAKRGRPKKVVEPVVEEPVVVETMVEEPVQPVAVTPIVTNSSAAVDMDYADLMDLVIPTKEAKVDVKNLKVPTKAYRAVEEQPVVVEKVENKVPTAAEAQIIVQRAVSSNLVTVAAIREKVAEVTRGKKTLVRELNDEERVLILNFVKERENEI